MGPEDSYGSYAPTGGGSTALGAGGVAGDYSGSYGEQLPAPDDVSVGQIIGEVVADLSTLMRQELELAKAEVRSEVKKSAKGAGMLGAAGFAGYFLVLFASLTLMFLLDVFLPLVLAALLVTLLWGVAAALLASRGRQQLKSANLKPEQTIESVKEDVQWAKNQKR